MKKFELISSLLYGEERTLEIQVNEEGYAAMEIEPDPEKIYEEFVKLGMCDGLPIIPPTEKRVKRMLEWTDRPPDQVIAKIPPCDGEATVEKIAINAVMAGCEPYYFPFLITAVEACGEVHDALAGAITTTYGSWPMILVNGPLAEEVGINCSWGCMGSGFRANNTIGRALTLIITNIGGSIPGVSEKKPLANPNRFGICFAENEGLSPWPSLREEKGFQKDMSTVTIFPATELLHHNSAKGSGTAIAEMIVLTTALSNLAETNVIAGPTGAPILIILNPSTAKNLHEEGWSKHDIKRYIFMQAGCSREEWEEEAKRIPIYNAAIPLWPDWVKNSPKIPVVADPEDIWIVVAGSDTEIAVDGIVPSHPVVRGMPVIKPITLADCTPAKRIRQFHKLFG